VALMLWGLSLVGACGAPTVARDDAGKIAAAEAGADEKLATDAAVRAAFAEATGRQLDDEACIHRPAAFEDVIVVGRHLPEVGCALAGMFVLEHWVVGDIAVQRGLTSRGWPDASPTMRRQLAWDWTRQVVYAFGPEPIEVAPPAFAAKGAPRFAPPVLETADDGSTTVTVWVAESRTPEAPRFSLQRLRYDADGSVTTQRVRRFDPAAER
jgi:hypothetical protein